MKNKQKCLKILKISYDWRNIFENNFVEIKRSLERDRLAPNFNKIFLLQWGPKFYHKKQDGIETIHIKAFLGRFRIFYDFLSFFITPFILLKKKFRPDIFLIRDFPLVFAGLPLKIFFKTKTVFFLGSMPTDLAKSRRLGFFRWSYQRLLEIFAKYLVDFYFANGTATRDYLINLGVKKEEIKIMVENVISRDENFIARAEKRRLRRKFGIGDSKKILLSVGRLEKEKGFERLISAFSRLHIDDLVLVIVGDGVLRRELEKMANDLDMAGKIFFAGYVPREEIWNYYKDADAFILLSYSEGNPTVFREAMYMGVPVIGSKIDGIIEFIGADGDKGFLWDEKEGINKLEEKISKAVNNLKEVEEIKKRAKSYIEENISNEYIINDFL